MKFPLCIVQFREGGDVLAVHHTWLTQVETTVHNIPHINTLNVLMFR